MKKCRNQKEKGIKEAGEKKKKIEKIDMIMKYVTLIRKHAWDYSELFYERQVPGKLAML